MFHLTTILLPWRTDLFEAALSVSRRKEDDCQHGQHQPQHHRQASASSPRAIRLSHLCFLQTPAQTYPHYLTLLSLSFEINPTFHFAHSSDSYAESFQEPCRPAVCLFMIVDADGSTWR